MSSRPSSFQCGVVIVQSALQTGRLSTSDKCAKAALVMCCKGRSVLPIPPVSLSHLAYKPRLDTSGKQRLSLYWAHELRSNALGRVLVRMLRMESSPRLPLYTHGVWFRGCGWSWDRLISFVTLRMIFKGCELSNAALTGLIDLIFSGEDLFA